MSDSRNFAALDWVVHEITDTLKEARDALESYVENPKDEARLRFCLTHIHQVHGSLQMVEFYGAAMMAEEMENLAQAMINDSVANTAEAQEVLMRAILQFPVYLEKVKTTRRDNPVIVLPLLNDLRAVRGESLLTETKLFSPYLGPAREVSGERLPLLANDAQFKDTVRKLRQMYQYAAAGFIRGVNPDENLAYLKKVFERLHKLTRGTARQSLWHICLALIEALEMDAIESSVSIKNLLRQLDRELKQLLAHGTKVLAAPADDQLLKNLLYYVARSGKHSPGFASGSHLQVIYDRYELERALPEGRESGEDGDAAQDLLSAPDAEAMSSVVTALKGELDAVKEALDVSLSDADRKQALEEALPVIKRVADTMAVLGIGDLRKQVLEQGAAIELVVNSDSDLGDDQLMALAGKVLDIEYGLDTLVANAGRDADPAREQADLNLSRAQESVLRESRSGLEQAKDAIVEYIASQWDRSHLQPVPVTLREIRGGLDMIPLPRPARIIGACARFVEEQLLKGEVTPEWSRLDTLADAITSVEYYLERFNSEHAEENDLLLGVAEESVAQLGYAVTPSQSLQHAAKAAAEKEAPAVEEPLEDDSDLGLDAEEDTAALSAAYESAIGTAESEAPETLLDEPEDVSPEDVSPEDVSPEEESEVQPSPDDTSDGYSVDALEAEVAAADASEPEPEANSVDTSASDDDDEHEVDEEILEIFIEEAGEVSEAIAEYFPRWAQNFADQESLTEFRRAFHTLKGSGRMVGATDIGELAWAIENMLNRVLDGTIQPGDHHVAVIEKVRSLLPDMIEAFRTGQSNPHPTLTAACEQYAAALSKGEEPDVSIGESTAPAKDGADPYAKLLDQPDSSVSPEPSHGVEPDDDDDRDTQLWEIFGVEALTHLQVVDRYIQDMEDASPLFTPPSDATQRALHTLKGSAHMANITPIAELATPLERFVKELRTYQVNINDDILQLLRDAVDYTTHALADIEQGQPVEIPRLGQFQARVAELREIFVAPLVRQQEAQAEGQKAIDPELLAIFMAEEMNLLLDADKTIESWRQHPEDLAQLEPLQTELATLTNGALHANLPPMAELGDKLYRIYGGIQQGFIPCDDALCQQLIDAHMALLDLVDAVAVGQNLEPAPDAVQAPLDRLLENLPPDAPDAQPEATSVDQEPSTAGEEVSAIAEESASIDEAPSAFVEEPSAFVEEPSAVEEESSATEEESSAVDGAPSSATEPPSASASSEPAAPAAESAQEQADDADDGVDEEILEIFLEEADDLMEDIDRALTEWQEDWSNPDLPEELKRSLHTLKGGARLSGITDVGDLAHDFETLLIGMRERDTIDRAFFQRLTDFQDKIHAGVARVRSQMAGDAPDEAAEPPPPSATAPQSGGPVPVARDPETGNVVPFTPKPKPGNTATSAPVPPSGGAISASGGGNGGAQVQHLAARRSGPQEVVRVSAELLEELVNLAGETSITRGRIEEQVGDLGLAIDEMDSTIVRLQEQLRRLDIETEAQVIFRQEQMEAHEEFDPLEMDRYSQLQQLSRSLMESASDLLDLKNTLSDKNRDTETLLLQQSRINTDLQEGLMRSRMVPFSRLVPRLRRIVRQAATELGKDVEFELDNVEGELDRSVLERMVAPLEHMLRNAVDHGIETADQRAAAGKPAAGRIMLSLAREGGDVVLRLADDGRGINLDRVRAKAVERGLMTEDAQLSDRDIMQFILHAGFSTADKVTQISGRGVGMDVVHSEIKQLGGSMFINSESGRGSEFIVRLPFTVSVNRALMIQIGDDYYAVPLNTIEGIVRVSPFELEHYYSDESARFEYAGEEYQVRYLGAMLDSDARPKLDGQSLPLPVVLVRSAEHTVALQVDRLLGSSEIVVKTLGMQFSSVSGVSGATVMGDGSVVVILDPHALMREKLALGMPNATLLEPTETPYGRDDEQEKVVMVVDDSVTVRKVTGRFLEREGFRVITAKDGAEALLTLQDHIPDVMLLDIEMPRMDGFEVASNMRSSSRLKDIPIIMITSRTGEKHRERAFNIGVDKYMGKPYQEELLLNNIRELLETTQAY
ncbi:Hpt domain-containing protein [Marinimicrobium sp. C6131]|uniref:Hpt domain-containing protein n=1 Tax=Marinimicrobium sp. C6131 TaxID=3022676 RepID=UPI00223DF0BB|nr:Hpt domain-containing protein [Marinimicrobium sp. C6131]UZJ43334.1 Hpt domain-containing protein [Marinimicrobium sp. C6131]